MCTLQYLKDGRIVVNDFSSGWDLIIMDSDFNETTRLDGMGEPVPKYRSFMNTNASDSQDFILWIYGTSHIAIVDLRDLSVHKIEDFWLYNQVNSKALSAITDPTVSKIAGIGFIPGTSDNQTIHIYDGHDKVAIFETNQIISENEIWLSIESSLDGDIFFIGGTSEKDYDQEGDAFIAAISFNLTPKVASYERFDSESELHAISCMRRHPDGDLLFLGCVKKIAIVLWAGGEFHLLHTYNAFDNGAISDLSFLDESIYCINSDNYCAVLYFQDSFELEKQIPQSRITTGRDERYRNRVRSSELNLTSMNKDSLSLQSKPSIYKSMYKSFKIQQIEISTEKELRRIQASLDGKLIYAGYNGLIALEVINDERIRILEVGQSFRTFTDFKLIKSTNELILFDQETSDLVKYSSQLKYLTHLTGVRPIQTDGAEMITTLYNGDDSVYIWMLGDRSIALVDPKTFEFDKVSNFFGDKSVESIPFTAIASLEQRKILGLYIEDGVVHFSFLRQSGSIIRSLQSEVIGSSNFFTNYLRWNFSMFGDLSKP